MVGSRWRARKPRLRGCTLLCHLTPTHPPARRLEGQLEKRGVGMVFTKGHLEVGRGALRILRVFPLEEKRS